MINSDVEYIICIIYLFMCGIKMKLLYLGFNILLLLRDYRCLQRGPSESTLSTGN